MNEALERRERKGGRRKHDRNASRCPPAAVRARALAIELCMSATGDTPDAH
jgi:hypothetical protein